MMVTFKLSKLTVPWDDKCASLLELAEAHGLKPDYSCRAGVCSTCISELLSGEISYFTEPLDPPEEGMALWAGQGHRMARELPAGQLVEVLVAELAATRAALSAGGAG